ncbi:MAG: hypothetical protein R3B70_42555 [Polyangiaceae bacterium]
MLSYITEKNLDAWLGGYARHLARNVVKPKVHGPRHLLFAICDHYEPLWDSNSTALGDARMQAWSDGYPAVHREFRDADGFMPRHSFFFPGEQYTPRWMDALAKLTKDGFGEVELHMHHDHDTRDTVRAKIERYKERFAQHGLLSVGPDGARRYAFIHGNWCLANARRDGRNCGVDDELVVLFESGCYADFTFAAAPDESQPRIVNQIYWPTGDLSQKRAYEQGEPARVGHTMDDRLLMITGPLAIAPRAEKVPFWIDNAGITQLRQPTPFRLRTWVNQNIHIEGRPEWVFVKAFTHGAPEPQAEVFLGDPARLLHRTLAEKYNDGTRWKLHYVTAREMFNIAMAAMDGKAGDPGDFRDYRLPKPEAAA